MTLPNKSSTSNTANPPTIPASSTTRLPTPPRSVAASVLVPHAAPVPVSLPTQAWEPLPFQSFPPVPQSHPNNSIVADSSALRKNLVAPAPNTSAPPLSESSVPPDQIHTSAPSASLASSPESRPPRNAHKQNAAKDGRRLWHRRALEESGASPALIKAIDEFNRAIPPIPNQVDHGRKTQVRDMRRWITILQEPQHAPVWHDLVSVLKIDSSAKEAFGDKWDHHLCRFILQAVVSEDNSNALLGGRSQTRQAVNNAIKRELACPTEGGKSGARGKSSRSKTFLELFREKCRSADVQVPPLEHSELEVASTTQSAPQPQLSIIQQPNVLTNKRLSHSAMVAAMTSSTLPFTRLPFQFTPQPEISHDLSTQHRLGSRSERDTKFQSIRASCSGTDEWGRTAWWELSKDDDIVQLPSLLMEFSPFQLNALLIDFRWIMRTFKCVAFPGGRRHLPTESYDILLLAVKNRQEDYSALDLEAYRLIRNALMLIIPILTEDTSAKKKDKSFFAHLATQLTGRLLDLKRRFPSIAVLVQSIERHAPRPWLRPLSRCFQQPKTDIKLAVPSNGPFTPHLIILSDDGKLLVTSGTTRVQKGLLESAARKVNLIRIWDVDSGRCLLEERNIPFFVRELALSRDKSRIMFQTVGGLYFWHLKSDGISTTVEKEVRAQPEVSDVTSIAPTGRSDMALTTHRRQDASYSGPISLWDTTNGTLLKHFTTVLSSANCIDVSSTGETFVSGHNNGFIHIWNLSSGIEDVAGNGLHKPSLSFQNVCEKIGPQPVKPPEQANESPDDNSKRTISVSFRDNGEGQWVAAVSSDEIIRVWALPPEKILENRTKQFVSALCQAVIPRPRTYVAQWAPEGRFYTGGDDGLAYEWECCQNDEWRWFAIDRKRGERASEISTALISVGKKCDLVATYQTKSPYVTVWDMKLWRDTAWVDIRSRAYRSHCAMKGKSVDATDIQDLTVLKKMLLASGTTGEMRASNQTMSLYGDNLAEIRKELENNFRHLDPKMSTRTIGEMQPRLIMELPGEKRVLEVCFDQPVTWGVSGIFVADKSGEDWGVIVVGREDGRSMGDGMRMDMDHNIRNDNGNPLTMYGGLSSQMYGCRVDVTHEKERQGMVAALQDGSVALFERENGGEGSMSRTVDTNLGNDPDLLDSLTPKPDGTIKKPNEDIIEVKDATMDDNGAGQDSGDVGATGDGNSQGGDESRRKKRRTGDMPLVDTSSTSGVQ